MAAEQQNIQRIRAVFGSRMPLTKPGRNQMTTRKIKGIMDGLATVSDPNSLLTRGILVTGSKAIRIYQHNRCAAARRFFNPDVPF